MSEETVPVPLSCKKIQGLYNFLSPAYDLITQYEIGPQRRALEIAAVREGFKILEVGFGTGKTMVEHARRVGSRGTVYGLDVSLKMVDKTRKKIENSGFSDRLSLVLGDATGAPFLDCIFDLVFSSYLLDLIDTPSIPKVLSEFERILKPGGRLVIVSLSKGFKWYDNMKLYLWLYRRVPSLLGGCRPVILKPYLQELGLKRINTELVHAGYLMPTEIIWGDKT
jgi:ubiquinone/menaquinone biosynthesis C-methylase UbiE